MSLIYQALKQTEQRSTASPATVVRQASVAPAGRSQGVRWYRHPAALGLLMVTAGGVAGVGANGWLSGSAAPDTGAAHSAQIQVAAAVDGGNMLPRGTPAGMPLDRLPTAELPLPTVSPQLKLAYALPQAVTPAGPAEVPSSTIAARAAAPAEPAGAKEAAPALLPPSPDAASTPVPVTSAVDIKVRQASVATGAGASANVADLFESLNRALANRDQSVAQSHLTSIQSRLPESSVARLRAEAWFAHQTGDADGASQLYRRLLAKLPGDEQTSLNLASVEKTRQQPGAAKEVLSRALQHNPTSSGLRAAMSQLAQSEGVR